MENEVLGVFLDSETIMQQASDFSALTSTLDKWEFYDTTSASVLKERIINADVVVTNKVPLTGEILQQASRLKCICIAATGSDHVDIAAAKALGITVCNVVDYSTDSVIQHTIGLLIALASRIVDYDALIKQGAWVKAKHFCLQNYRTMELAGKVLGIVGYGAIGKGVAQCARMLGMQVQVAARQGQEPSADRVSLLNLLPQVDVLSLHCPLTLETRDLIGECELAMMKPGALLLNVSRGGIVNEAALAKALISGHLGGCGLDVSAKEPPLEDSPLFQKPIPNLIATPHVAWSTQEARLRLLNGIAANIRGFLAGQPSNVLG